MNENFLLVLLIAVIAVVGLLTFGRSRRAQAKPAPVPAQVDTAGIASPVQADTESTASPFQDVFEMIPDALFLLDGRGRIVRANGPAHKIAGLKKLEGRQFSALFELPALGPTKLDTFSEINLERGARSFSLRRAWTGPDSESASAHQLLIMRDVTSERQLDKNKRDFVTNASHELKTPLARMGLELASLRTCIGQDERMTESLIQKLDADIRLMRQIVTDLLDLAKIEAQTDQSEGRLVQLDQVVKEIIEEFREPALAAGVELETHADEIAVVGRGEQLILMVRNLVDNAIAHSSNGGTVTVEVLAGADPSEGQALIKVSDQGSGIPSADLERIFERFYRVDKGRSSRPESTGVGLAIVKHVVQNHGGRIIVESQLGRGSTFTVFLPLNREATESSLVENTKMKNPGADTQQEAPE